MTKTLLALAVALCVPAGALSAPSTSVDVNTWKQKIERCSIGEIANLLEGDPVEWPKLSLSPGGQTPKEQNGLAAQLATKFIRAYKDPEIRRRLDPVLFCRAANGLDRAGGTCNSAVADSFRRIALYMFAERAVVSQSTAENVATLVEKAGVPEFDLKAILQTLSTTDPRLSLKRERIDTITSQENIFDVFAALEMQNPLQVQLWPTSRLLQDYSAEALILRRAATAVAWHVQLRGALAFLQKGGSEQELNPADIRPFRARMAGSERDFSFSPMNVRKLRVYDVKFIFDSVRDSDLKNSFIKAALE